MNIDTFLADQRKRAEQAAARVPIEFLERKTLLLLLALRDNKEVERFALAKKVGVNLRVLDSILQHARRSHKIYTVLAGRTFYQLAPPVD